MTADLTSAQQTPIHSMSPAQQQERYGWDKRPYVAADGSRWAHHPHTNLVTIYRPRVSEIPGLDPKAWECSIDGFRAGRKNFGWCDMRYRPSPWPVLQASGVTRTPHEFNPILSAFRERRLVNEAVTVTGWLKGSVLTRVGWDLHATLEQVAEARTVLGRLARMMEAGK